MIVIVDKTVSDLEIHQTFTCHDILHYEISFHTLFLKSENEKNIVNRL